MPDKPTSKRPTLVEFVATDVYLNEKWSFIVQLLYVFRGKLDSATFSFIRVPVILLHFGENTLKGSGNWFYNEFKGHIFLVKYQKIKIDYLICWTSEERVFIQIKSNCRKLVYENYCKTS